MYNVQTELEKYINQFQKIGGESSGGVTRLLYDQNWLEAQNTLKQLFLESGLDSFFDSIGNLYGRVVGEKYKDQTIASGSHIDTVLSGGKLDGFYGIIGAFIAVNYLLKTYGKPLRTIEIASFAEEEGSRFPLTFWGSKNYLGLYTKADIQNIMKLKDKSGILFEDAMQKCGFDSKSISQNKRDDIKAFIEIHIEQGSVLETIEKPIGIVHTIVGQKRYNVTIKGEANHAGTTPMSYRKDAVYCFSKICSQSIEKANEIGNPLVLTFGKVNPFPNVVNVVPGEVQFTIDCRHTDKNILDKFTSSLEKDMIDICKSLGLEIVIDNWMNENAVPMDAGLVSLATDVIQQSGLLYNVMPSGAGHDSQILAVHVPTVMLFVPSIKGISHNPLENTLIKDLVIGVEALIKILYKLAYEEC